MKEKETIIAKIKENKKTNIKDANIDGEPKKDKNIFVVVGLFVILLVISVIYKFK